MAKIHVFYHLFQVNDWREVYKEQMEKMEESGLSSLAKRIHIGVIGDQEMPFVPKRAVVTRHTQNRDQADTMQMLADLCKQDISAKVCFLHSKGVTKPSAPHASWRKYLNYWTITCWKKNVKLLSKGDCVGTNWRIDCCFGRRPHFSGCFWWANASFINDLDPEFLIQPDRYLREFWIGSTVFKKDTKIIEMHNSGLNNADPCQHYFHEYPEYLYIDKPDIRIHEIMAQK